MLPELLVLIQQGHGLLLSCLTALFCLQFCYFKLLDLIMHSSHDLLFNFSELMIVMLVTSTSLFLLDSCLSGFLLLNIGRGAHLQIDEVVVTRSRAHG